MNNSRVGMREKTNINKIAINPEHNILQEYLDMRTLCSKWVALLLTVGQKQERVEDSERCSKLFRLNKKVF